MPAERTPHEAVAEPPLWRAILVRLVVSTAIIALLSHTVIRVFHIPSESMEPTLRPGDRVAVRLVGVDTERIARGSVIAFAHGDDWEQERRPRDPSALKESVRTAGELIGYGPSTRSHTVKRVIGTPGSSVRCCDDEGRVEVDGAALDEPYLGPDLPFEAGTLDCASTPASQRCFPEITVPEGSYLVLGDHRARSADSVLECRGAAGARAPDCARFVRADQVVGLVSWRVWPFPPGSVG